MAVCWRGGMDEWRMDGEGVTVLCEVGDQVQVGERLERLVLDSRKAHAPCLASAVLWTEREPGQRVRVLAEGEVRAGDPLIAVETLGTGQPSQTV